MTSNHHRKLEHMYHSAPTNRGPAPRLSVGEGTAEVRMQADASMHHAADAVHGHWLFKLLDDAAFFAANSLVEGTFVLTVHFDVHLLSPVREGQLVGHGEVVHEGTSSLLAQAVVADDEGSDLARGTGTFVKGKRGLDTIESYRLPDDEA